MKALAVFCLILGVMAMVYLASPQNRVNEVSAIAINYAVYRNAVFTHVIKTPTASNSVTESVLKLPKGWHSLRSWQNRITSTGTTRICYVFGSASMEEISAMRKLFMGSAAVGYKKGGVLLPAQGGSITLPAFIPEGAVVSVIEVKP